MDDHRVASNDVISVRYRESEVERLLEFTPRDAASGDSKPPMTSAEIAQNRDGYAMLKVRKPIGGDEVERYYGLDMAIDHVAAILGVAANEVPIPPAAEDMGI